MPRTQARAEATRLRDTDLPNTALHLGCSRGTGNFQVGNCLGQETTNPRPRLTYTMARCPPRFLGPCPSVMGRAITVAAQNISD